MREGADGWRCDAGKVVGVKMEVDEM